MDFLKKNPFLAGLGLGTAVLLIAAGYLLYLAMGIFSEQEAAFDANKTNLERLQSNKPFPNEENVKSAQTELEQVKAALDRIRETLEIKESPTTPQAFQDTLRKKVNDIKSRAEANGVALDEGFYLGFENYETEPPPQAAAPQLALQLESIFNVASILVDARVRQIGAIARQPLASELPEKADTAPKAKPGKDNAAPQSDLVLAPFDVAFVAEQQAFEMAFNRIVESKPLVFVRLVAVTSSGVSGPPKIAGGDGAAQEGAAETAIKPVLGQEVLTVNLQLASLAARGAGENRD